MGVVEVGLGHRPAQQALHLGHGEPPVRQGLALGFEAGIHELFPSAAGEADAKGHGIEEKPHHPLAVFGLRTAGGRQRGDDVPFAAQDVQDPHVSRQENALDRHRHPARHRQERLGELRRNRHGASQDPPPRRRLGRFGTKSFLRGQSMEPAVPQVPHPVVTVLRHLQVVLLKSDVVTVAAGGRHERDLFSPQELVVGERQLGEHEGVAPAVDDGVVEGKRKGEGLVAPALDPVAHHGQLRRVEATLVLALEPRLDGLLLLFRGQVTQVFDHQVGHAFGMDQLQRLGKRRQVEHGAKRRMALDQPPNRGLGGLFVERGSQVKAEQVVVDRGSGIKFAVKEHAFLEQARREGVLNPRRQALAILGAEQTEGLRGRQPGPLGAALGKDHREVADRARTEELVQGEIEPPLPGPGNDLDAANRIATQREVVVVNADPLHVQGLRPQAGEDLFDLGPRRGIVRGELRPLAAPIRQGLAVELAVRRQRDLRDGYKNGGNHVVGQRAGEFVAQLLHRGRRAFRHEVGHQARIAGRFVFGGQHRRITHRRMAAQRGRDLGRLDAITADLQLVVGSAEEFQDAVRPIPGQVTGPVETRVAFAQSGGAPRRIGHEALRRQPGLAQVTARQGVARRIFDRPAADAELTGHPYRNALEESAEQVDPRPAGGPADRHRAGPQRVGRRAHEAASHDSFRRSVLVVDPRTGKGCDVLAHQGLAAENQGARVVLLQAFLLPQEPSMPWCQLEEIDVAFLDQRLGEKPHSLAFGHQDDTPTGGQGHEDAGQREVEGDRRMQQRRPGGPLGRIRLGGPPHVAAQAAVRHAHALGPARRT